MLFVGGPHVRGVPEMRKDISRRSAACCAPQKYELHRLRRD
jgi:hypothetical protein